MGGFYALCCAGALACAGLVWALHDTLGQLGQTLVLTGMMFTPLLAAAIVQRAVGEPLRPVLGLRLRPDRWWLAAWLLPLALALATLLVGLALPGVSWSPTSEGLFLRYADLLPPEQLAEMRAQLAALPHPALLVALSAASALIAGPTINTLAAFGEEAGWRGWLLHELRPLGFWRASLLSGALWGLWHAPIILQGHNYPQHPVAGVAMMTAMCVLLSPVMTWIRWRSGTVLTAALYHGVFNATAGLPLLLIVGGDDLLVGVTGLAGLIVHGLVCGALAWTGAARGLDAEAAAAA